MTNVNANLYIQVSNKLTFNITWRRIYSHALDAVFQEIAMRIDYISSIEL